MFFKMCFFRLFILEVFGIFVKKVYREILRVVLEIYYDEILKFVQLVKALSVFFKY